MSTTPSAAVFESYVRSPNFEALAANLELSPELWDVFAQTEQRVSAATLAGRLSLTPEIVLLGLRELAQHGLLRKHVQRWNEYRGKAQTPAPAPVPPAAPPAVSVGGSTESVALAPAPAAPVCVATVSAPAGESRPELAATPVENWTAEPMPSIASPPREIRFTCAPKGGRRHVSVHPSNRIGFVVRRSGVASHLRQPAAETAPTAAGEGWRLRPLLDAIVRRGGGGVPGQLLAYRVFLRVPAELLDRAGLHSLNLVDEDFVIRDGELHAAIRRSMAEVAGLTDDAPASAVSCLIP